MKVKDFVLKKKDESKGPRDFTVSSITYNKFLMPIIDEFGKYNVEMTEIILFSILTSARNRKKGFRDGNLHNDKEKDASGEPRKAIFNVTNLDSGKMEFLLSVMVYLYGEESIFNYKAMIKNLEDLAEEGLEIIYNKYANEYLKSPSKFIDDIFSGKV